jgi:UDP-N-acetylglucosamine diphosphorylase / glucose-1-phosphate thymidylyltransferase / UDP-N-acetylgalactosamine diphosphorylase / glucosamine-1-phosphate N-acetyltransferase / galactosamine-1-phosphate N-acetyltransferase
MHRITDLFPGLFDHKYFDAGQGGLENVWEALDLLSTLFDNIDLPSNRLDGIFYSNEERVFVEPTAFVEPGAMLCGPCYIGEHAEIRHCAYIRPYSYIGRGCVVGHSTEVVRSILLSGAKAAHFNYVGDSILGERVMLGAGAKIANLRLDGNHVSVRTRNEKYPTGRRKVGAFLGDGARVGCNAVVNPGSVIEPGSHWVGSVTEGLAKPRTMQRQR